MSYNLVDPVTGDLTKVAGGSSAIIDDSTTSGNKTWSSEKINDSLGKVANSIIREVKSVLYNLNNVDNIEVAIDIAKSGYKPIAVSLYNAGTHLWFAQGIYFNDTVCNLSLRGVAPSSATNAECGVLVTYIKTS